MSIPALSPAIPQPPINQPSSPSPTAGTDAGDVDFAGTIAGLEQSTSDNDGPGEVEPRDDQAQATGEAAQPPDRADIPPVHGPPSALLSQLSMPPAAWRLPSFAASTPNIPTVAAHRDATQPHLYQVDQLADVARAASSPDNSVTMPTQSVWTPARVPGHDRAIPMPATNAARVPQPSMPIQVLRAETHLTWGRSADRGSMGAAPFGADPFSQSATPAPTPVTDAGPHRDARIATTPGPALDSGTTTSTTSSPAGQIALAVSGALVTPGPDAAGDVQAAEPSQGLADQTPPTPSPIVKSVHFALRPAHLGAVDVRLTVRDDTLRLHLRFEQTDTAETMRAARGELTELLAETGLAIDGLLIDVLRPSLPAAPALEAGHPGDSRAAANAALDGGAGQRRDQRQPSTQPARQEPDPAETGRIGQPQHDQPRSKTGMIYV